MTPDLFRRAGEALLGPAWKSELARRLHPPVNERTVGRWANGQFPIPAGVERELGEMLAERAGEIADILDDIPSTPVGV